MEVKQNFINFVLHIPVKTVVILFSILWCDLQHLLSQNFMCGSEKDINKQRSRGRSAVNDGG